MRFGVIGSGDVGQTLAAGLLKHGYEVMIGSRTPAKLGDWAKKHKGAQTGSFAEAAKFGEAVVLAVDGGVAADALRLAGAENLKDKPVLDACNPAEKVAPVNGVLRLFTGPNESLMERSQKEFPEAKFVKAFSCVGAALMVDPKLKGGKPTMFICGNDDGAKKVAIKVLEEFGWEIDDMGKVEAARAIEPLCLLWCIPGFLHNEWTGHALKMLKVTS